LPSDVNLAISKAQDGPQVAAATPVSVEVVQHPGQNPGPDPGQQVQSDLVRATAVISIVAMLAFATEGNKEWIATHQDTCMLAVFLLGYAGIILEELVALHKSGVALLMASALWSIRAAVGPGVDAEVAHALSEVSEVIFFLLGAMTVVEVVDSHEGFSLLTRSITTRSKVTLLWVIGLITFFLSAMLDNLTTTIVMVSLLSRACPDPETRRFLGAVVVIAANAGGVWTPIGDITTTMLWVNGQITTLPTIKELLVPSLVSLVVPMLAMSTFSPEVRGSLPTRTEATGNREQGEVSTSGRELSESSSRGTGDTPRGKLVLSAGIGSLLFVPIFKTITGLPPYMGMLAGLGFLWLLTDAIHLGEDRRYLSVSSALKKIDAEGVLFFLGILMSVAALNAGGLLKEVAYWLDDQLPNEDLLAAIIGLASAVVDNVPLVAATQGMYDITQHPVDSQLWQLIAYCAGTGGSLLIIGSSSGVAYMGLSEGQATFGWWVRRVTPWALLGYASGLGAYVAVHGLATTGM